MLVSSSGQGLNITVFANASFHKHELFEVVISALFIRDIVRQGHCGRFTLINMRTAWVVRKDRPLALEQV